MFSLVHVLLPVADHAPAEAIRASLAPFERGMSGTLPDHMLAFHDETDDFRERHESQFIFDETATGGLRIEGGDIFHLDTEKIRAEMSRRGLRRWQVRFADEMDLDAFVDRFGRDVQRHPDTGAFGRWLNPIGRWDWWDLGGRFDGCIIGERQDEGRGVAEISSGPNPGRAILGRLGDVLADALEQPRLPNLEIRNDRNIEMVATVLADAREGRWNAFPAALLLPPGTLEDRLRWLGTWPETAPPKTVRWLGLTIEPRWEEIVMAAYARFEDHWAAAITYHH